MSEQDPFIIVERLNNRQLNYIMSVLHEIREQVRDYGDRLLTLDLGTCQGIRDQLATFTSQLADMHGDMVTELELTQYEYNVSLKQRKLELWSIFQNADPEINPDGKVSSTQAQDKSRYQAEIDVYPIAKKIARVKGLVEQSNAIWRYTIPKLLDSIASRIALTKEYPNGLPSTTMQMSKKTRSDYDILFGDLDQQVSKAKESITDMDTYQQGEIPENSAFNNPDL